MPTRVLYVYVHRVGERFDITLRGILTHESAFRKKIIGRHHNLARIFGTESNASNISGNFCFACEFSYGSSANFERITQKYFLTPAPAPAIKSRDTRGDHLPVVMFACQVVINCFLIRR